jgi:hypothetical protein
MGDVALHLRGGTVVPMQHTPAGVTGDVRLSPVTLVVALPSGPAAGNTSLPPYALEETCEAAHQSHSEKLVSCGYLFMDSGEDIAMTADNSAQVNTADAAMRELKEPNMGAESPVIWHSTPDSVQKIRHALFTSC